LFEQQIQIEDAKVFVKTEHQEKVEATGLQAMDIEEGMFAIALGLVCVICK